MKKPLLILISLLLALQVFPCTTFFLKDQNGKMVFGRNYDFPTGEGHLVINKRNLQKTAFIRPPEKALQWISKYGSISFNQAGKEFPYGGMNEAGLVIEQMWLKETLYPEMDERYGLSELQWIQYQLDMSGSVQEVIDSDSLLRISPTSVATLHFLVADRSGDVATIEYINGKMQVHREKQLPYPVLANCPYERSLDYVDHRDKKTGKSFSGWTKNSSGRFARAAEMIKNYNGSENIEDYAFRILENVAQEGSTQWSIVYDLTNKSIAWKTMNNAAYRSIELSAVDFACDAPDLYVDVDKNFKNIADFSIYSFEDNLALIRTVFSKVDFLKNNVPEEAMLATAKYPESIRCADKDKSKTTQNFTDEEFFVEVPQSRLYVRMRGNPKKPVLLNLHGGPGGYSGIDIALMGPGLEKDFFVAYLDQRGCGKSDACDNPEMLTVNQYVEDLDLVITALLEKYGHKQLNLMGTSWGGMYGFLYQLEHPGKVAAYACIDGKVNSHYQNHALIDYELELIDGLLDGDISKEMKKELKEIKKELRRVKNSNFENFHTDVNRIKHEFPPKLGFNAYFADTSKIISMEDVLNDPELLALMKYTPEEYLQLGEKAETVNKAFRDTPSYNNMNIERKLREIEIPVAVIQGEKDFVVGRDHAHIIYQALKSVPGYMKELHILPDVGHVPAIESPEKLREILLAFFKKYGAE